MRKSGIRKARIRAGVVRTVILRTKATRTKVTRAIVLGALAFFFAAALSSVFFLSCEKAQSRTKPALSEKPPVFPYSKAVREASTGSPVIFVPEGDVRQRGIARTGNGFLYWDFTSQRLIAADTNGKTVRAEPREAAFTWVSSDAVLTRSGLFEEGKGFLFILYSYDGTLRKVWSGLIDCFPSDVLFRSEGEAYIAGGNRSNTEKAIFKIKPGKKGVKVLSMPIREDFLRLVGTEQTIFAFASGREKKKADLEIYALADTGTKPEPFKKIEVTGLPHDALTFFGYGFSFQGEPVLPLALEDKSIALVRLEGSPSGYRVASIAQNSLGCVVPLGDDSLSGVFRYLAHDGLKDTSWYGIGSYDGEKAEVESLE